MSGDGYALFWKFTQRRTVVRTPRFGTNYRYHPLDDGTDR